MTDAPSPRPRYAETTELLLVPATVTASRTRSEPDIDCAEWNLLFQAVIDRLESLAGVADPLALKDPDGALSECIAALDQLRNSAAALLPPNPQPSGR